MSRETLILRARAAALVSFVDECTIQHPTGLSTNTTTGAVTPTYTTVYDGVCLIQGAAAASATDVAEAHLAIDSPILHVPITVLGVSEGDLVTMTASRWDPDLPGRTFRIQGPHHKSYLTARRFQCTEITS